MRVQNFQAVYLPVVPSIESLLRHRSDLTLNTLSVYTKTVFTEAGIDTGDRRIVNHSARVTCCTRLYSTGFDEQCYRSWRT